MQPPVICVAACPWHCLVINVASVYFIEQTVGIHSRLNANGVLQGFLNYGMEIDVWCLGEKNYFIDEWLPLNLCAPEFYI
jgi:hypothetical protein